MKLIAFRIRNFRSIKDTGWQQLAYDNITCLIGQNESGKTSVLEGLRAFHNGLVDEDMLRSDLSLPQVSCRFEFNYKEQESNLSIDQIHPDVIKVLQDSDTITITRKWESDLSCILETGEELEKIFGSTISERKSRESKVEKSLQKVPNDYKKAKLAYEKSLDDIKKVEAEIAKQEEELAMLKKGNSIFSKNRNSVDKENVKALEQKIKELHLQVSKKKKISIQKDLARKEAEKKMALMERISNVKDEVQKRKVELAEARGLYKKILRVIEVHASEKEVRTAEASEEQSRLEIELAEDEVSRNEKDLDIIYLAAEKTLGGTSFEKAFKQSAEEINKLSEFLSQQQLGEELFELTPAFEMFEDFSSLLPNRIELEDILHSNINAEGYKAAINFLTITGLDYSFFNQPSSRILKQKIENLNGELTLNFQDFWQQNVGKNNKIKINFELAHFDNSYGEKSAKHFIYFCIKD